jgi:hypothetical protein
VEFFALLAGWATGALMSVTAVALALVCLILMYVYRDPFR